jgi:hypothetical protein
MDSKTEMPPTAEGDPEPAEGRTSTALYALLGDRVPAIFYEPRWSAWVCHGDIPPMQFPSLEAYLDEFPLHVAVSDDCIVVTDPGFGKGTMEWIFRVFTCADGRQLAVLTETDANADNYECRIWVGEYNNYDWDDRTEAVLPSLERANFFAASADSRILEDFELVSLQYSLPRHGDTIQVQPLPNVSLECVDGRVMLDDLDPIDERLICEAWQHFRPQAIRCTFDRHTGRFELDGGASN